jgi:hypothetical protein
VVEPEACPPKERFNRSLAHKLANLLGLGVETDSPSDGGAVIAVAKHAARKPSAVSPLVAAGHQSSGDQENALSRTAL